MRAVRCQKFSALVVGSDGKYVISKNPLPVRQVLTLDSNLPKPSLLNHPNHVLIQTHYAGVQYPDMLQAQGLYQVRPPLPYIPGLDLAGVVVDTTSTKFKIGDRVMATMTSFGGTGALAEFACAPDHLVWSVPPTLHLSQCANIGRNYFAAYHSLKNIGKITRNNPGLILVDGASGGVGMATIAIAKAMGSKVIAGVSTENKMHHPKAAGADVVLCYGTDKETYLQFKDLVKVEAKKLGFPAGVDVVVDVVQGDLFESALISCVRPLGVICLVGFTAGQKPIRPGLLLVKEVIVAGSIWGRFAQENPGIHRQNVEEILNFFSTGAIKPRASTVFPIEEFADTFELFESNKGQGNNVIEFLPSPRL